MSNEVKKLLQEISKGYLEGDIKARLYARVAESLIALHPDELAELEEFAEFLALYNPTDDTGDYYNDKDLLEEVDRLFRD